MKRAFYSKAGRLFFLIAIFICSVALAASAAVIILKETKFTGDDFSKPGNYAISSEVKKKINDAVSLLVDNTTANYNVRKLDKNAIQIAVNDYDSGKTEYMSINSYESVTNSSIIDDAREFMYYSNYTDQYGNSFNVYSTYAYNYYDYKGDKVFMKISREAFQDIVERYTVLNYQEYAELPKELKELYDSEYASQEEETEETSTDEDSTIEETSADIADNNGDGIEVSIVESSEEKDSGDSLIVEEVIGNIPDEIFNTGEENDSKYSENANTVSQNQVTNHKGITQNIIEYYKGQGKEITVSDMTKIAAASIVQEPEEGYISPVYNSYDLHINPNSRISLRKGTDGNDDLYTTILNKNFGENCYLFQQGTNTFLYSSSEGVVYNDCMGWVPYDYVFTTNYMYIPVESLDFSSKEALEQSILLAPQFNSLTPVFFAGMYNNYYETISDFIYSGYSTYEDSEIMYCYNLDVNGSSFVSTNAMDYADIDAESYSDCENGIVELCDVVFMYDSNNGGEKSYYEDTNGNVMECSILTKENLKLIDSLDTGFRIVLGININKHPESSKIYWDSVLYSICSQLKYPIVIFVASLLLLLISFALFTRSTGISVDDDGRCVVSKTFWEKMPFEIVFILASSVIVCLLFGGFISNAYIINRIWNSGKSDFNMMLIVLLIVYIAVLYLFGMIIYQTVVRRVKARVFVEELLIVRFYHKLVGLDNYTKKVGRVAGEMLFRNIAAFFIVAGGLLLGYRLYGYGDIYRVISYVVFVMIILFGLYRAIRTMKYATGVNMILVTTKKIENGDMDEKVDVDKLYGNCKDLAESVNSIGDGLSKAVDISTRDERMKAELITNVSHDIKTPLTSIINYVDLIKREHVENEKIMGYVKILDQKSQRLKQLIEDLVEASKASTGNLELDLIDIDLTELLQQTVGEFDDRFTTNNLTLVTNIPDERVMIYADGRRSFRIVENLFQNAFKYAMPGTRVYLDVVKNGEYAEMTLKNVSKAPLNISPEELTERFVRGDSSRTTEGSGLGLSIAKDLAILQNGDFKLNIDGDLFSARVSFKLSEEKTSSEEE